MIMLMSPCPLLRFSYNHAHQNPPFCSEQYMIDGLMKIGSDGTLKYKCVGSPEPEM